MIVVIFLMVDEDFGDSYIYEIVGGYVFFDIDGDKIVVKDGVDIDFEIDESYMLIVKIMDVGGFFYQEDIMIDVVDVNEVLEIDGDLVVIVDEGGLVVFMMDDLNFIDEDDVVVGIMFLVFNLLNGEVYVGGNFVISFMVIELVNGDVFFVYDGFEMIFVGFNVIVEDGNEDGLILMLSVFSLIVNLVNDVLEVLLVLLYDQVVSFNGIDQYLIVVNDVVLWLDSWIIEVWVCMSDDDGVYYCIIIVLVGGQQIYFLLVKDGQVYVWFDVIGVGGIMFYEFQGGVVVDGDWYYVVGSWDSVMGILVLYVDGQYVILQINLVGM